jgi:preprotein translocase subunit SecY
MIDSIGNIFRIPELKKRVLFVLGMLFVFRLGTHIPTPGINVGEMIKAMEDQGGGLLGFYNLFSGGALTTFSIFSLGIMPYISASIILQLLTAVIPALEALAKEGDAGRKKITQYTRYLTVAICIIQAFGMVIFLRNMSVNNPALVLNFNGFFVFSVIISLTTGTIFLMWLGEQMTEHGIGNGMSMLIFAGIIARVPQMFGMALENVKTKPENLFLLILFVAVMVGLTAVAVVSQQSYRRIPVQYAQRIVGRKIYRGQSTQLPLKIDYSGVIAVIFSSAVMVFPSMIAGWMKGGAKEGSLTLAISDWINGWLGTGKPLYELLYAALIIFFCYFYTAISFNPTDVAENMKKHGGFIPGIRPGPPTAEYINNILSHITLGGALLVVFIAIVPNLFGQELSFYFGGTTLLIMVGVALDTVSQIESHLLMRHYEGFMKSGKIRGRRG